MRHRLARLLTAAIFVAGPTLAGALPASATEPSTVPTVSVSLTTLRPIAPQPGDTLVITGTVTNNSDGQVEGLGVQLRMGAAVGARSTFDAYAADPNSLVADLPIPVTSVFPLTNPTLAPGHEETFQMSVPLNPAVLGLPTSSWQVRELGISVTGTGESGTGPVGGLRTFLPWAPHDAIGPLRLGVAWLWPLVDRPHRISSSVWTDDGLAPELAAGGRLGTLLAAATTAAHQAPPPPPPATHTGRHHHHQAKTAPSPFAPQDVPVTWAIDPMLLDDVSAMHSPYQVASSPKPVAGTGSNAARTWLAAVRSATTDNDVVSLPYGDPDVAAAVRNGLSTLVGVAAAAGHKLLEQVLPGANALDVGWPPGGLLDQRAVDALFSDGATSLVLSDAAIPPVVAPNETPDARASLVTAAGDIPTALSDSILSTAVSEGAENGADTGAALQRFLAETLMIEAEAPSDQRDILLAPARRWSPPASYADELLADTGKVPWLKPTTVSQILAGQAGSSVERAPLTYPRSARRGELAPTYLHEIGRLQHSLSQLTDILPPGDAETRPYSTALMRSLSSAWRGLGGQRHRWIGQFEQALHTKANDVHIVSANHSTVTLTGHGGKVPVTITNTLDAPAHVTVQLDANQRLTLPGNGRVDVAIPAGQQTTVDIHATAKTSGVFSLTVQLLTPNGQKYGTPRQLFVRSTVYGTITLVITGVATAALLVAVAIRLTRRGIAARRAAGSATP